MTTREFTVKSVSFAVVCLLIVCIFPAYSEKVLKMTGVLTGYLPLILLFLLVMLSCVWNMVAGRLNRRLALGTKELAVLFCMMLFVAWVPWMMGNLVRHLVLPRYEELTSNAVWKEAGFTTRLPTALFPAGEDGALIGERVHFGFIQGGLTPMTAPYAAWVTPMLLHWMPLVVVLSLCVMALSFLVHRQWVYHEQLRYPLASIADALIRQDPVRPGGAIYRNKLFWGAFALAFGLRLFSYLYAWFPNRLPQFSFELGLGWSNLLPIMGGDQSNTAAFCLEWMVLSFAVVGIAYFVPSDVSLSVAMTAPLGTLLGIQLYLMTGKPVSSTDLDMFRSGGYIAFGLILLYTGRTYYFPVLMKALLPRLRRAHADPGEIWAARLFLSAYVCLVILLLGMGFDLVAAVVYVSFLLLVFLVVTRLVCETGIPSIAPAGSLPGLLCGLFGPAAIGAVPLVFMTLLSRTITDSSQLVMPYMATSLKILDDNKVRLRRFAVVAQGVTVLVLVVACVGILALAYTSGEGKVSYEERGVLSRGVDDIIRLKDTGQMVGAETARGVAKLALVRTDPATTTCVLVGLATVVAAYVLRFRFSWWPLHPLFFLMVGTGVGSCTWFGFLLGWAIKTLVIRFGGARLYNAAKPFFVGLIAGELLCLATTYVVGLIYHLVTGATPVSLWFSMGV